MPPSLADMIPQDLQILRELLEKTQPFQIAPLEMCPLHLLLKDFYRTYIAAQLDLDLRSLVISGASKSIRSQCPDQRVLVKDLAQGIPDNFDPYSREDLHGHDDEWTERFEKVLKLSDAAKDLDASLKELDTKRKEAREIEAKREGIRQVQKNLTGHLQHFLDLTRNLQDILDMNGDSKDVTDACLDLSGKVRSATLEVGRIHD